MPPTTTMGVDVGITNLGIGTYDGETLAIGVINLQVENVRGRMMKVELTPERFVDAALRFVDSNAALFATVAQVLIEIQMKAVMKQLAQALAGAIKGRCKFAAHAFGTYAPRKIRTF